MTTEESSGYRMPFSGPAYAQTMANLGMACLIPQDYLADGAHFPEPDEIIAKIYAELEAECWNSAMHFGCFRAISSKYDTIQERLDSIHSFFAGMGSKSYFNKAVSVIKQVKFILLGFATNWDKKCSISVPILEKSVSIDAILDTWKLNSEKKFFTKFIRDICEGIYVVRLKDFPALAAQIMKPAFKSFYRDHLRVLIGRKKAEARNAYDVRQGTYRRRVKRRKAPAPVMVRLRPEPKEEEKKAKSKKHKPSKSEKLKARNRRAEERARKQRQDYHITIWTPLTRSAKFLSTCIPMLVRRMKAVTQYPTLNIISERRSAAVHT